MPRVNKIQTKIVTSFIHKLQHINPDLVFISTIIPLITILSFLLSGDKSLWLDEGFSIAIARMNWSDFWYTVSQYEANQAFYYFVLKLWLVFGDNEIVLRSLSAVSAICAVAMAYILGKHLFGWRIGILSALLLTVNATFIIFAQETRGYMLALLLGILSSYFFIRAVEKSDWKLWVIYILSSVFGVYTHLYIALLLLAQGASLLFLPRKNIPWKGLLTSAALIIVLVSPMAYFVLTKDIGQIGWIPKMGFGLIGSLLNRLSGGGEALTIVTYSVAGIIALFFIAKSYIRDNFSASNWRYSFVLCLLALPVVVSIIISFFKPMFIPRYFVILIPFLVYIVVIGINHLKNPWVISAAVVIVLIFSSLQLQNWYTSDPSKEYNQRENWRDTTDYIISMAEPSDAIIFYKPVREYPYDYYREQMGAIENVPETINYYYPDETELNFYFYPPGQPLDSSTPTPDATIITRLEKYNRVWLVMTRVYIEGDKEKGELLYDILREGYGIPLEKEFYDQIKVSLFNIKPVLTAVK